MAKFENLTYYKLFSSNEGKQILASILANKNLVNTENHNFWKTKFRIAPDITPTDAKGVSAFTINVRETQMGEIASMRAPLSHSAPLDLKGRQSYTGTIPSFSPRQFHENSAERWYKQQAFENGEMNDEDFIYNYAVNALQFFVDSGNQTLSHYAAQVLSTGKVIADMGIGNKGNVLDCHVPAANFLNAGSAAWTSADFALLDHLRSLVETLNSTHGEMGWQLEITRARFVATFLNNTQVLNWIKLQYAIANGVSVGNVPSAVATVDYAVEALNSDPSLPRIVIIQEKQNDVVLGTVSGWADNKYAVVRPMGYAGYICHATPIESKVLPTLGAKAIRRNIASALNGLGIIVNSELDNGELLEWHSQFIMNAIPALDEFIYHYIIDTSQSN